MYQTIRVYHKLDDSVHVVSEQPSFNTVREVLSSESSVASSVGPSASMAPPPPVSNKSNLPSCSNRRTGIQTETQSSSPPPPTKHRKRQKQFWTVEENEILLKAYRKYGRRGKVIQKKYLPHKKVQSVLDRFKTLERNGELPSL